MRGRHGILAFPLRIVIFLLPPHLLLMLVAGCSGPEFKAVYPLPNDKAVVYVYDPLTPNSFPLHLGLDFGKFPFFTLGFRIYANGESVGRLNSGEYLTVVTLPGVLSLSLPDNYNVPPVVINAQAGDMYLVRISSEQGVVRVPCSQTVYPHFERAGLLKGPSGDRNGNCPATVRGYHLDRLHSVMDGIAELRKCTLGAS